MGRICHKKINGKWRKHVWNEPNGQQNIVAGLWMHGCIKRATAFGRTEQESKKEHSGGPKVPTRFWSVKQTSQFLIPKVPMWQDLEWAHKYDEMFKDAKWWLGTWQPGHGITLKVRYFGDQPRYGKWKWIAIFKIYPISKKREKPWITSNPASIKIYRMYASEYSPMGLYAERFRNNT